MLKLLSLPSKGIVKIRKAVCEVQGEFSISLLQALYPGTKILEVKTKQLTKKHPSGNGQRTEGRAGYAWGAQGPLRGLRGLHTSEEGTRREISPKGCERDLAHLPGEA